MRRAGPISVAPDAETGSTRPFLEDVEKKWLAYQLLCALRDSHARNVYHGDIKTENVLVTSWNWLYLTDYSASFKKTYLPEDNPADFSYYFDTSGRRTCYLAPERFLRNHERDDGRGITWAMDVFSVGCVIAELFLESPIFSLSQLFKYRKGEYNPYYGCLNRIQDKDVRELIIHMIQLEPESRYSAEEYLNFWRRKAFPEYFYSFLHQYMGLITDPSSGRTPVLPDTANFGEADDRIERVFHDFDKISYFLGYENARVSSDGDFNLRSAPAELIPIQIDIPNNRHEATIIRKKPVDDGSLIYLTLVVSSLRNTARSNARIRACDLMLAFAERITDEAKLDRVLPYVMSLLNDRADVVKITAIRTMTQILSLIRVVSPVNAYVFSEYVRPRLQHLIASTGSKASPLIRSTYASCLAPLAHASVRILEMLQALRADGSIPSLDSEAEEGDATDFTYQHSFDIAKLELLEHFETHTKALLTDKNTSVRRAFLGSVSSLCVFFGSSKANDVILSHLNTYLNDKDWQLKCAFFQTIVGVATFVGAKSLEEFIMPLVIQALSDPEEFVIEKVIRSFANMAELGLFERSKTWEMIETVGRFMLHPNPWVREAATHFISSSSRYISTSDLHCIVSPLIRPYLKSTISEYSEGLLLDVLKRPLSRQIVEMATIWAKKGEGSLFWKPIQHQRSFTISPADQILPTLPYGGPKMNTLTKLARNNEDEKWIQRMRNLGLNSDDDHKLLVLKEYIWLVAQKNLGEDTDGTSSKMSRVLCLKEINVTPQTVFFEKRRAKLKPRHRSSSANPHTNQLKERSISAPHTIADALLDASTTIDDNLSQRKRSYANARKERLQGNPDLQNTVMDSGQGSSNIASPMSVSPRERRSLSRVKSTDTANHSQSDGTITPTNSLKTGHNGAAVNMTSAINLLDKKDSSKTPAATGTTSANAIGKLHRPFIRDQSNAPEPKQNHKAENIKIYHQTNVGHTYDGNDPSVMRLLDSLAFENYPYDIHDFGPIVTPVIIKNLSTNVSDVHTIDNPWRPQGNLIAAFGEHTAPINRVIASPDHAFFITASDDGTVKVWDSSKLERNLAHRSRQTYSHADNVKVKCICFVENTHTFVSGATDGSIRVVKVDYCLIGEASKYGKLRTLRNYQLPDGEFAVWFDHSKSGTNSLLLLVTNASQVIALDLRSMSVLYSFKNPLHHGVPTCFCVDHHEGWMLIGTSHGVLDLWDLRFRLRLKSWGLAGGTPIHRLVIHPFSRRSRDEGRWVFVAGGTGLTDVTVWDIEKTVCREAYRVGMSRSSSRESLKVYEPWKVDDDDPEGMLGRFATAINPSRGGHTNSDIAIRALAVRVDPVRSSRPHEEKKDGNDGNKDVKNGFLLTGGIDKKLRSWDFTHANGSMVISGLDVEEEQPDFLVSYPTPSLTLTSEKTMQQAPSAANATAGSGRGSRKSSVKQPRSAIISLQQQQLLKRHLDTIMDVALLEYPVCVTISVDRMGCIYVFQ